MGVLVMTGKHFLTIIRKSSFIDLYKYGYVYIRKANNFDGDFDSETSGMELFKKVTADMNCFEYSFECLMLHFMKEASEKELVNVRLDITQVHRIYVFDEEAKREMEISFGPQLQVHVSKWSDSFNNLKIEKYKEQNLKGVDNLWKIFDLDETNKRLCRDIITDDILSEIFEELFLDKRPNGDLPVWVYLLRYERHSFYPKNKVGTFCDLIHVVLSKVKEEEEKADVAQNTKIYNELPDNNDFDSLVKVFEGSENFMNTLKNAVGDEQNKCKFYVVAPLYLYLREIFSNGLDCTQKIEEQQFDTLIDEFKKKYGFDFCVAAYMLGLTLGYDKTYDAYYKKIELPILKPITKDETLNEVTESQQDEVIDSGKGELDLFGDNSDQIVQTEKKETIPQKSKSKKSSKGKKDKTKK